MDPAYNIAAYNPAGIDAGVWTNVYKDVTIGGITLDVAAVNATELVGKNTFNTESVGTAGGLFAEGPGHYSAGISGAGAALSVLGLSLGTYEVYVSSGIIGATSGAVTVNVGATSLTGSLADGSKLNLSNFATSNKVQQNNSAVGGLVTDSWVENVNYVKFSVNLTSSNPSLLIYNSVDQTKAFNFIQIVQIPEPSTYALLGIGAVILTVSVWRRRRA